MNRTFGIGHTTVQVYRIFFKAHYLKYGPNVEIKEGLIIMEKEKISSLPYENDAKLILNIFF